MLEKIKTHYTETIVFIIYCAYFLQISILHKVWDVDYSKLLLLVSLLICIPLLVKLPSGIKKTRFSNIQILCMILSVAYIMFRLYSLIKYPDFRSVKVTLCFEIFFILLLNGISLGEMKDFDKLIKSILLFSFIIMFASAIVHVCSLLSEYSPDSFFSVIKESPQIRPTWASLFKNPNPPSNLIAILLIFAFNCLDRKKIYFWGFAAFAIFFIIGNECRTAELGLILIVIIALIVRVTKVIKMKVALVAVLIICLVGTACIVGFVHLNDPDNLQSFNEREQVVSDITADRYKVWKYYAVEHGDYILSGHSSLDADKYLKRLHMNELFLRGQINMQLYGSVKDLGPHNGYIAMWVCAGLIPSLLAFTLICLKILTANNRIISKYGLVVAYILIYNLFESGLLLTYQMFTPFLLMVILVTNKYNYGEQ